MASVSQTIDNYSLGLSAQPDARMIPGQLNEIINCTPDLTEGLPKRIGSRRVGRDSLSNVQSNGTFFHYYRDENEGAYIGQIANDGKIRMWCTKDISNSSGTKIHDAGDEIFVHYDTVSGSYTQSNYSSSNLAHQSITSYLAHSSSTTEDIQPLTINDTTFLTNRTKVVDTKFTGTYTRGASYVISTSAANHTGNYITYNNHNLQDGDSVVYQNAGGASIGGLTSGTTYYVIRISANWFRLATTKANAEANVWITLTSAGNNSQYFQVNIVTVTKASHGLVAGDTIDIDFTTGGATDGEYDVLSTSTTTFTIFDPAAYSSISSSACTCTPLVQKYQHKYYAYVDLLRTENGRQYSLNITDDDSSGADKSIKIATRVKISSTTQDSTGGTGHCPGIGTQVFAVTAKDSYTGTNIVSVKNSDGTVTYGTSSGKKNLIFRITALGQMGNNPSGDFDDAELSQNEYICVYNNKIDLLHGGEGWNEGDKVTVTLDQANTNYNFEIQIEKIEESIVKASIKDVRPEPTPFDADTAVTVDHILGGLRTELAGLPVSFNTIGNGIYLWSDSEFSIEIPDKDLMRVMHSDINNVSDLPNQCHHGYIVKVNNVIEADEDDYYLRFVGENGKNGPGSWEECAKPGSIKGVIPSTMPHIMQRQPIDSNNKIIFLVKANTWGIRDVGDDVTNPMPTFADGSSTINKVLFFRNRIALLSGENVILSRPGELAEPSFFAKTALSVSAIDPIDIYSSSTHPSELYDGIEIPAGLVVFSTNQQFLLSSDAEILNPDTAKFRSISHHNYDKSIPPISLGTSIGFVDNSGRACRFMEMQQVQREQEPIITETSKVIQGEIETQYWHINNIACSPENGMVFLAEQQGNGQNGEDQIWGFKYQNFGDRKQAAWFTWHFNTGGGSATDLKYMFTIDDSLFILGADDFLQEQFLVPPSRAKSPIGLNLNAEQYLTLDHGIYLDNWVTMVGGVYDSATKKTTFTHGTNSCDFDWHSQQSPWSGSTRRTPHAVGFWYEDNPGVSNSKPYALSQDLEDVVNGTSFKVSGDWSNATIYVGYRYDVTLRFPRFYYTQQQGNQIKVDQEDYLVLHRLHIITSGASEASIQLWTNTGSSSPDISPRRADQVYLGHQPYQEYGKFTVPVYEKNDRVWPTLTSTTAGPFNLQSVTWEGDYNPKNYRRV